MRFLNNFKGIFRIIIHDFLTTCSAKLFPFISIFWKNRLKITPFYQAFGFNGLIIDSVKTCALPWPSHTMIPNRHENRPVQPITFRPPPTARHHFFSRKFAPPIENPSYATVQSVSGITKCVKVYYKVR